MPSNFMHQPFANPRTGTKKFCKRFDARLALVALHSDRITNRARASRASSIFLRRIVGVVFMRVNWKCAHQVQPPSRDRWGFSRPSVDSWMPYAARAHRVEMGGSGHYQLGS